MNDLPVGNDMRFDCDARVEVWVTADEIQEHDGYNLVNICDWTDKKKIEHLRDIAKEIFSEKISSIKGVDITIGNHNIAPDRIDWNSLIEDDEDEDIDMDEIEARR